MLLLLCHWWKWWIMLAVILCSILDRIRYTYLSKAVFAVEGDLQCLASRAVLTIPSICCRCAITITNNLLQLFAAVTVISPEQLYGTVQCTLYCKVLYSVHFTVQYCTVLDTIEHRISYRIEWQSIVCSKMEIVFYDFIKRWRLWPVSYCSILYIGNGLQQINTIYEFTEATDINRRSIFDWCDNNQ